MDGSRPTGLRGSIADLYPDVLHADRDARFLGGPSGTALVARFQPAASWFRDSGHRRPCWVDPSRLSWSLDWERWADLAAAAGRPPTAPDLTSDPRFRRVSVFAIGSDPADLRDLGQGLLASYGLVPGVAIRLCYAMETRLDRRSWVLVGGYEGWAARLGPVEWTSTDADQIFGRVAASWGETCFEFELTRYDGDHLHGVTDSTGRAALSDRENEREPERFSGHHDPAAPVVSFALEIGEDWELPESYVVDRRSVLELLRTRLGADHR